MHKTGNTESDFKKGGEECGNGSRTPCRKGVVMLIIEHIECQSTIDGPTSVKSWIMCVHAHTGASERRMGLWNQESISSSTRFFGVKRSAFTAPFMVHPAPWTSSKGYTLTEGVDDVRLHRPRKKPRLFGSARARGVGYVQYKLACLVTPPTNETYSSLDY